MEIFPQISSMKRLHRKFERIQRDPQLTAKAIGLRYVSGTAPGLARLRRGKGFGYVTADGTPCRDKITLRRIQRMVLPPAWETVWICADETGHLQATGIDAKGRKQYRYHEDWNQIRNQTKYYRLTRFAEALPAIRVRLEEDLRVPGLPYHKVLALAVKVIELTCIRVGNEAYKKLYGSVGLTTLQDDHVDINGSKVQFQFRGKKGVHQNINLKSRRLANLLAKCRDIPGDELFQYYDEQGKHRPIGSGDVNGYLKDVTGADFTAKDFRTWAGTVAAFRAFQELGPFSTPTEMKRNVVRAYDLVAERLGNTRTVCKKYYVHPAVVTAYETGKLETYFEGLPESEEDTPGFELSPLENAVKRLIEESAA
ncbi:MAG: DNA topoisomerase IB [Cytophagaceae bacterium]|nr:DNA topoisomerase IB [Cytophagaceae bacterium]